MVRLDPTGVRVGAAVPPVEGWLMSKPIPAYVFAVVAAATVPVAVREQVVAQLAYVWEVPGVIVVPSVSAKL